MDFLEYDENLKYDLIIGNPPYHKRDGGSGVSSKPLYHFFILTAIKVLFLYVKKGFFSF